MHEETKFIDITPHRSILTKISQTGYSIQEALSELIDNAIDARKSDQTLNVTVNITKESIVINDNGSGMTEDQAAKSIRLGFSEKQQQLGEFGLGLKTSTSFLGHGFTLTTTPLDLDEEYRITYDADDWLDHGDWYNYPFTIIRGVDAKKSGTRVEIHKLRVHITEKLLSSIKAEFGLRFGPFIQNHELNLVFNDEQCEPFVPIILDDKKTEFSFVFPGGRAWGWWGYQLSGLNKSYYGFHTYRRGRLVTTYDKIGLTPNQDIKQIIGDLHIEGIPINHDKKNFAKTAEGYRDLEDQMRAYFKPFEKKPKRILSGYAASAGRVRGTVKFIRTTRHGTNIQEVLENIKHGDIIVTEMTRPQYLLAIRRSAGIITDLGGNLCHAAIVSREFDIPCVVGTQNATSVLVEGNKVILDGNEGYVYED